MGAGTGIRNKASSTQQPRCLTKSLWAALLQEENAGGFTDHLSEPLLHTTVVWLSITAPLQNC